MSEELIKILTQLATLATVLVSLWVSLENRRLGRKNAMKIAATAEKLDIVHEDVNGKIGQLIVAKEREGHALGLAEGRQVGITELASRVAEKERVEDRVAEKLAEIEKTITEHDKWEREVKK